ncbi:hypothetical protein SAMN02910358_00064 [Lachnospiraceae bacterium XBB1006]|nr:hypothetical protein SAMN02910358_00064 [Lachnospiraceae bacterium XBB1006]
MNGYAQLVVKDGSTYVRVIPPTDGGKKQDMTVLTDYLERNQLTEYGVKDISVLCEKSDGETLVKVGPAPFRPYDEQIDIDISMDKMLVFCTFFPPSEGGNVLSEEEIITHLNQNKVVNGVDKEGLEKFLSNREYNKSFVIAKGQPPRHGKDGKVEYFFNTSLSTKPKKNEDGTVNYHDLNTVSIVQKGQKLAERIPADLGDPGVDVFGNEVKPRNVKEAVLSYANNITLSEDGNAIFSDVTGHATLTQGKVFVSDVLDIPADVDTSTGDIDYEGAVLVHGNVKSGFKVRAKGDVVVEGVVEGAEVISEGQIVIKRGIHGMNKGVLDAKGNILCKFVENAQVISGGYLETEGIMHSKVSATTNIIVHGKKAMIAGGVVRAGALVEVDNLGSEMGATTVVEVGVDPKKKARFLEVKEAIAAKKKEIEAMKPILQNFSEKMAAGVPIPEDKMQYVQKLSVAFKTTQTQIKSLSEEYDALNAEIATGKDAKVKVTKDVYAGVTITISDVSLTTKSTRSFCQFVREAGEVAVKNL